MTEEKQLSDSYKELKNWLDKGEAEKYFDADFKVDLNGKDSGFRDWLDQGRLRGFLKFQGVTKQDIYSLKKRFNLVIRILAVSILFFAVLTCVLINFKIPNFWIVAVAGILGSSAAAFISTLDRYANGVEDFHGNAYPDSKTKKERFNERFSNWLLYRPILGIVAAALIFYGSYALIPANSTWKPSSSEQFAFLGLVAGLFA